MTKTKFLLIILGIALSIAVIDVCFGLAMRWYVQNREIPGDYRKIEYMRIHLDAPILLLGASTCMNSINPDLLKNEIGKNVFNGGLNDQRLELFDIMCDMIFRHSTPELLVLVMRPNDLTVSGRGRISMMNIYYHLGYPKLDHYLNQGQLKKKILLNSALYRFNTYWWRIMLYNFKSFNELAHGGFVGKPVPKILPERIMAAAGNNTPVNSEKLQCLKNILETCRRSGTCLWIVIPPEYYKHGAESESPGLPHIRKFCEENKIFFVDDSQHPDYMDHPEYFFDNNHLNIHGAEKYTLRFLNLLREKGFKK